jgi:acetyltransferase-like isoleucine patch superfamily enzyme
VPETRIGDNAVIRSMSLIYGDVVVGHNFIAGHGVVVRGNTRIGNDVELDNGVIVESNVQIGDQVKIGARSYVPSDVVIGNKVNIGEDVVLSFDRFRFASGGDSPGGVGPVIEDQVVIGARAYVHLGVTVGKGSYILEGTMVTKDVPPQSMVSGSPAKAFPLTKDLTQKLKVEYGR